MRWELGFHGPLAATFALVAGAVASAFGCGLDDRGLQGRVFDLSGKPVAGAWVEARRVVHGALEAADFAGPPKHFERTRANGYWSVSDLATGNWIVTVVAGGGARSDAELQELARPRAEGDLPAGVAVARLFRHIEEVGYSLTDTIDLGVAVGAVAEARFAGRLTGAFDPEHFGYQVTVSPFRAIRGKAGQNSITMSSEDPSFEFNTVPAADGSFDLGALPVGDYDTVAVAAWSLGGPEDAHCDVFRGQLLHIDRTQPLALPVARTGLAHLTIDGPVEAPSKNGRWDFAYWQAGSGRHANYYRREKTLSLLLPAGHYLVQASAGELASPIVLIEVGASAKPLEVILPVQACADFDVQLVDGQGEPLETMFVKLTTPEAAAHQPACRMQFFCDAGTLQLRKVPPGIYDVEFQPGRGASFRRTLELKPDSPPIVVELP